MQETVPAAEYLALKALYDKQNEMGHAVVAENQKLKAEKVALQQRKERGGPVKMLSSSLAHKFTGQGGMSVEEWVDDLVKALDFYHITEAEKVETAVMLLKGPAAHWWKTLVTKGEATDSFAEFLVKLKEMFQPISQVDKARAALDHCVQGKRNVQMYTNAFRVLVQFLPAMDEGDQKHRYITNLNDGLRAEVLKAKPKTLEDAIHAAVSAEAYGSTSKGKFGPFYPARFYGGYSNGGSAGGTGTAPMEIGNVNLAADDGDQTDGLGDLSVTSTNGLALISTASGGPGNFSDSSSPVTAREKFLLNMVQELQTKQKVQDSIHAMMASGGSRGSAGPRVPNVSKADYERCRRENRCLRCKQPGHVAGKCTRPFSLKF